MSEITKGDVRQKVTPVGNSWIVCKSKRHQGHVYYFNSLTGEAAWNLSDAEIEKAKCRTKHLECIPGAQPTTCPEPKDKPPGTRYKPFIFNNVTEQQSSVFRFGNSNATVCTNLSQVSGVVQGSQINNPTSIKPVQLIPFNNHITTYTVNSTTSLYNPKVWDVPETQQIFVGPTTAPVLNHTAYPINVGFSNLSQPLPGALKQGENTNTSRTYYPRDNNYDQRGNRGINKKVAYPINDLRQKILKKKRFHGKQSSFSQGSGNKGNARKPETSSHNAPNDDVTDSVDVNDGTKKGCSKANLQEVPSKFNVMPLKRLAPLGSSLDAWFIIVDLGVLLNEFKFVTTLTDSDEKCHLMVPKRIMEELKTFVTCTENIQARRILRFLSQQIETGYANMAEEPCNLQGNDMAEVLLKTCEYLMEKKYHVVLISDDNEVLTKASSNIPVFTIVRIKNLLFDYSNKQTELPICVKKPFSIDKLFKKVQITAPKNSSQVTETIGTDTDTLHIDGQGIQKHNTIQEVNNVKKHSTLETCNQKLREKQDKIEQCVLVKHTVDTGIQTDFEDVNASTRALEKQIEKVPETLQNKKDTTIPEPSPINVAENKTEINLVSIDEDQAPNLDTKKRRFKRGRKKKTAPKRGQKTNTAPPPVEQKSSRSDEKSIVETIESPSKNTTDVVQIAKVEADNTIKDDSNERNTTTIEEPSTLATISNSDSNVDTIREVDPQIAEESNRVFKNLVLRILTAIREALNIAQLLSVQCHTELKKPRLSSKVKGELKTKVEKANVNLIAICRELERMVNNESDTIDKMRKILKKVNIDIRNVDPALIEQYKLSLINFKNIADEFLDTFQTIKSSFGT
ncbi:uncharacterized protein LOC124645219 [Helicoverpa zea]|uniref:uncharacterized protein LOC124645219 n=1 Tax=Helicoverpa zea TaxID=7113 RepID=UPI001F5748FB|nr:uncharacterized protein LOC124645219 [Helicoverpa zea]XP_047040958.1 uncharacterized protein LOC124645219 [Helicoverpa zea]